MECCRISVSQKKIHNRLVETGCVRSVSVEKKYSMLMWFTQRQVRVVVVLVGECRSCFCCINVYRFGVENFRVETRETTG